MFRDVNDKIVFFTKHTEGVKSLNEKVLNS